MNFCPECGSKVNEMKFCPECGKDLQVYDSDSSKKEEVAKVQVVNPPEHHQLKWFANSLSTENEHILSKNLGAREISFSFEEVDRIEYKPSGMTVSGKIEVKSQTGKIISLIFGKSQNDSLFKMVTYLSNAEKITAPVININNIEQPLSKKEEDRARIEELKRTNTPYCPKCHSTSLTFNGKKLSIGRAAVGGVLAGGAGAVMGGLTSKKGKLMCLNCGHKWKI